MRIEQVFLGDFALPSQPPEASPPRRYRLETPLWGWVGMGIRSTNSAPSNTRVRIRGGPPDGDSGQGLALDRVDGHALGFPSLALRVQEVLKHDLLAGISSSSGGADRIF